ncbi:ribose 5-phosphate isomerase B [Granulicatella balaenopterae]|uniref:Ribose 5-phosphate isomerase B n=1 Tax=Granulicatella balaenopterae TaxID=137733 RepID=A0A1H9P2J1_9LACT|nr:ribose 5-phosphate isomerase B [Granulicatella balaenopterae]SER42514.1 ribose 5-phosphate isomerase B [Granulicatella balaenopterae]
MKIGLGSDHNAYILKETIKDYLIESGYEVEDYGCYSKDSVDYPEIAKKVAEGILSGEVTKGILCCGTGIGMAMAANKIKGIRAAQVHDVYSAERAELSNNAHIITLGSKVVGDELAKHLINVFLNEHFKESPSSRKIQKIMDFEK